VPTYWGELEKFPVDSDTSSPQTEYNCGGPRPHPDVLKSGSKTWRQKIESWLLVRPFGRVEWRAKRFPETNRMRNRNKQQ
jgi:hypothetical protein